jgi:hypothetical protein
MMIGPSLALPAVRRAGGLVFFAPATGTTWTLASLGVGGGGVGTYLWRGSLETLGTGTIQNIMALDDGSVSNAYTFRHNGSGTNTNLSRTIAGASSGVARGALSAGVAFSVGFTVSATGDVRGSLGGAAVAGVTGGPTSGLTTLRIGENAAGGLTMTGSTVLLRVLPGLAMADADLQAEVAAL